MQNPAQLRPSSLKIGACDLSAPLQRAPLRARRAVLQAASKLHCKTLLVHRKVLHERAEVVVHPVEKLELLKIALSVDLSTNFLRRCKRTMVRTKIKIEKKKLLCASFEKSPICGPLKSTLAAPSAVLCGTQ
jgi:hypothetical protein